MAEEEPIEQIAQRVRALSQNEVADLGRLPRGVTQHWLYLKNDRLIITGERIQHLFSRHPETDLLLPRVLETAHDPDEIHRNKNDLEMAILWRAIDGEGRYFIPAAVLLPLQVELAASVISARKTRREDFSREFRQGRMVWRRET